MIFKIISFNKELDMYKVVSNTGEQKTVTAIQIVLVMLQGYTFDNASLTQKGFSIKTNSGTRFIQVNTNKQTQVQITKFLNNKKQAKEQKRNNVEASKSVVNKQQTPVKSPQGDVVKNQIDIKKQQEELKRQYEQAKKPNNKVTKINSNKRKRISYKGNIYISEEALCRKFNRDVNEFKLLRSKGYSMDEALGVKPLRPEEELVSPKQIQRMLDSMAMQRGEY